MTSRWLPGLRALLTIGRELHHIRRSLDRLADAAEGRSVPTDLPAAPEDTPGLSVMHRNHDELARAYAIEQKLTKTLGRTPDPEEILHELDGREHG